MSSDYLGKFSLWSWFPRPSFSLIPGPSPVSGHEKSMFAKSIKDALYDVWESLGMLWSILEHIWGIWSDVQSISEIMDFHPEMTSPHTK